MWVPDREESGRKPEVVSGFILVFRFGSLDDVPMLAFLCSGKKISIFPASKQVFILPCHTTGRLGR